MCKCDQIHNQTQKIAIWEKYVTRLNKDKSFDKYQVEYNSMVSFKRHVPTINS